MKHPHKVSRPGIGPAISITEGIILLTSKGEAVVCYNVHKWGTRSTHVETTLDLSRASVNPEHDAIREAERLLGKCTRVPVKVERVVSLISRDFALVSPEPAATAHRDPNACCDNEDRGFSGGCRSCGDPCL
jgi:hypothetical protein